MKLIDYLKDEKISAAAFGVLIGVGNRATMWRYVRGERFPPPDKLLRIREVTNGRVSADDFVDQHVALPRPVRQARQTIAQPAAA